MERHLYGLIGEKLIHSFSPEIHERIMENTSIKGCYSLFPLEKENIKAAIEAFKLLGFRGINVTIPYKKEVMEHLDYISPEAEKISAVNTICFKDGKTLGYNTDYYGFGMMLETFDVEIRNKKIVVLGTGGASNSVNCYLRDNEAKQIVLVSREKKGSCISYEELSCLGDMDIIINTTPVGMYPNVGYSPISKEVLHKFDTAVDLIYNPSEPLFLKEGKEIGLKTINGLYMLVGQAIKAQEIWNEISISKEAVNNVYKGILDKFNS